MEYEDNQRLKLLYLMKIFYEKTDDEHSLSIMQLIDELAVYGITVKRKTLYSDINMLRYYDIDIVMEHNGRERSYHIGERDFDIVTIIK